MRTRRRAVTPEFLKLEVKQAWKMDMKSTITLRNTIIGCVNGFKVKESWLLYLYKNKDGSLATYCCCTRTRRLSDAGRPARPGAGCGPG